MIAFITLLHVQMVTVRPKGPYCDHVRRHRRKNKEGHGLYNSISLSLYLFSEICWYTFRQAGYHFHSILPLVVTRITSRGLQAEAYSSILT